MVEYIPGIGLMLTITDGNNCRHMIKVASIQAMGDTDSMCNECYITAAGRTHHCMDPLETIIRVIREAEADIKNY